MAVPKNCPVCGSENLSEVLRKWLFDGAVKDDRFEMKDAMAYRCDKGHVFMILAEEAKAARYGAK